MQESGTLQITLDYELDPFQTISLAFVLRNPPSSSTATKSIKATVVLYSEVLVPATSFSSSVLQAQGKVIVIFFCIEKKLVFIAITFSLWKSCCCEH